MKFILLSLIITGIVTIVLAPIFIPLLRKLKMGQMVRDDGPRSHLSKAGTPTMGGLIFLIAIVMTTIFFAGGETHIALALFTLVGYGVIGFADDYIKVALKRSLGLKARYKLTAEIALGLLLGILVATMTDRGTEVAIFSRQVNLGWFYPFFALIVLVATTNTVNLTDGLDGLAAGTMFFAAVAYLFIAWRLNLVALTIFAAALAGGCLGFLVFNRHPAKVFMGDTGSLALGGALGILAILTGTELLLFVIGGVYVIEALSVIIQVIYFRFSGKRFFLMSPLHHHFELAGWHETTVVKRFWFFACLLAVIGVSIFIFVG
ncbi:MAG: phospho-N-acetylmuramoyl-pentapeptide-transferase [Bacillota bacterium]